MQRESLMMTHLPAFEPNNKMEKPPVPPLRLLFWETTVGCNLECIHCRRLEVSKELSQRDLTTEQAKAFIARLPETGKPILVFSGGEPLKRPDLFELTEFTGGLGLPMALATNGTLITDTIADKIVSSGIRRVSISFDGPDPESHDQFRGAGNFAAAITGFKLLRKRGMSMQINSTIARHNYQKLNKLYTLADELGAEALHLFMLVPVGCGMELPESIKLDANEYEAALNWIYDRSQEGKIQMKATCAPHYFRVVRQRAKEEGMMRESAGGHPGGLQEGAGGAQGASRGGELGGMEGAQEGVKRGQAGGQGGQASGHPGGTSGGAGGHPGGTWGR